jgi:hypothetical protein
VDPAMKEECGPDGAGVEEEQGSSIVEEDRGTGMEAHAEEERAPTGVGK